MSRKVNLIQKDRQYKRSLFKDAKCRCCGAKQGQYHRIFPCQLEDCPFCGTQLISCECPAIYFGKPELTRLEWSEWETIVLKKGRKPFIYFPTVCCRCGELNPEFFNVSNEEWKRNVPNYSPMEISCKDCYEIIKEYNEQAKKQD